MYAFQLGFHWSLFLWVQLTIYQHWFRLWLGAKEATSHFLNQWCPDSKVHGTNMGPTWVLSAPDGPHVGPINIAIRMVNCIDAYMCHSNFLTLTRPGLCGWLRPTQFKPQLNWVGSTAQVRRYCVDSAAQAFIYALTGCVPRSLQYALCGPGNSRSAHFAARALDVLATHESPNLTQLST